MDIRLGRERLRDWSPEDAPALARHADNRRVWENLTDGFPHPYGLEDARRFIAAVRAADPPTVFAIASEEGEAIGSIGLVPGQDVYRVGAELGYWLAEPWWGRGIVTRAIEAVVDHAFTVLDLHRVHARPYATNPASIRVLEKAGFALEGIARAAVIKDGRVLDQYVLARIRP